MRAAYLAYALVLLLSASVTACGEPLSTPEPVYLRAAGSMAVSPLAAELTAAFTERFPLVGVDVTCLGTEYSLEALREGEVDFALASWLPSDSDPGWQATAIARDGVAIIVHPSNPVGGLGLLQLRDLFGGRIYDWDGVTASTGLGEVHVVSREKGSGTRAAFEALVMEEQPVTPMAVLVPSPEAVVDYVAGHPEAIGYVSMGQVPPEVKILRIEGSYPTAETTAQGSYPLTRELWLVTAGPPTGAVRDFVQFVLGPVGQRIVGRLYGRIG